MAKYRIATPTGASFTTAGDYGYEMEALTPIDAEIFEVRPGSEDEFVAAARDADALYAKGRRITKKMIDGLDRCKIIALGSVGVDSVDVEAATEKGIPVTNCPDTFIDEVADHAMTLILASFRRLIVQDRLVREGRWAEGRPMLSKIPRLMGLTLGLVSFGHVARAVAARAKPFGVHVIAYDPFIEELVAIGHGVEPVSLPELLQRSDIISMHAPATESANRLLREEHFRQMKKTALYISTGRGPTTDEAALIKALDEGWIAGAGLDVLEQEPPGDNNPLLKMDNVILTAHVASASARFDPARRRRVGLELSLVLSGKWPMSCVNPSVLAKDGPAALAAGVDGARAEFLISTGGPRGYRQTIFHHQRGIGSNGSELGPGSRPLPGSADERPSIRALHRSCSATPRSRRSRAAAGSTRGRSGSGICAACLWSDIPNDRMMKWDEETGAVSVFRKPSHYANGNTRDRQGRLITCEMDTQRVTRTEHDGTITVLADSFDGKKLTGPNDVVVKSDGSIWFSDNGAGIRGNYLGHKATAELPYRVYRLDPATGRMTIAVGDMKRPNGLAFSPDEKLLYVIDTPGPGQRTIQVYDVVDNGTATANRREFNSAEPGGSDGMRVDVERQSVVRMVRRRGRRRRRGASRPTAK